MKAIFAVAFMLFTSLSQTAAAAPRSAAKARPEVLSQAEQVRLYVTDFLLELHAQKASEQSGDCLPDDVNDQACVDFACDHLGRYGCDTNDEVAGILRACRGNYGSGCAQVVCDKLGNFGCDTNNEMEAVAVSCRNNRGGDCVSAACDRLGRFGCDTALETSQLARACQGLRNGSCLTSVCDRLGSFGCDTLAEVTAVLRECGGSL